MGGEEASSRPPKRRPVSRRKSEKHSVRNPDVNTDTRLKDSQGVRSPVSLQTLYVKLHEKPVTHAPAPGRLWARRQRVPEARTGRPVNCSL